MPIGEMSDSLRGWLAHVEPALARLKADGPLDDAIPLHDQLSQLNVLEQLERLRTYPAVIEREKAGTLQLHAWWFDLERADVRAYDPGDKRFRLIDAAYAEKLMRRFSRAKPQGPKQQGAKKQIFKKQGFKKQGKEPPLARGEAREPCDSVGGACRK
jgi:hypothetical protein